MIDTIDKKILSLLSANARCSLKSIAKEVGLSSPAVSARISRLERDGVIQGYCTCLNEEAFGHTLVAFISVDMKDQSKREEFDQLVASLPNVIECYTITGDYTILIKAGFLSMLLLDEFLGQLQKYGRTSTAIVTKTICRHQMPDMPVTFD